jgi:putative nucleotidyltransferase with HDIG domain
VTLALQDPTALAASIDRVRPLSTAAVSLSGLLTKKDFTIDAVEPVIRSDPGLTAAILRTVNSAAFGVRRSVSTVRHAAMLLGNKRLAEIALGTAFSETLPIELVGYGVTAAGFWDHCNAVAAIAESLARETQGPEPEEIYTAGLLHDIGKLVIATHLNEHLQEVLAGLRAGLPLVDAERAILGLDHSDVGAALAERWALPPRITDAIRWHHRPETVPDGVDRRVVDLVHVADGLAHLFGYGADIGGLARVVSEGATLRIGLSERHVERVAIESLEPVQRMRAVLVA